MRETSSGTPEEVSRDVARWLARELTRALEQHGRAVLALPGGRSIAGSLEALGELAIDWSRIDIVFADERHLPPGHSDRNDTAVDSYLTSSLVQRGALPANQLHRAPFVPRDVGAAAALYAHEIASLRSPVSVALFGAGEDGHIASLFPGRDHTIDPAAPAVIPIRNSPKPPPERISLSPHFISALPSVCILFIGSSKREAFARFRDATVTVSSCPARLLLANDRLLVAADRSAGGDA